MSISSHLCFCDNVPTARFNDRYLSNESHSPCYDYLLDSQFWFCDNVPIDYANNKKPTLQHRGLQKYNMSNSSHLCFCDNVPTARFNDWYPSNQPHGPGYDFLLDSKFWFCNNVPTDYAYNKKPTFQHRCLQKYYMSNSSHLCICDNVQTARYNVRYPSNQQHSPSY